MSDNVGTSTHPSPPHSPGVGARRKGPKLLPKLPLSAFSPPNSGISESFPLPASPSTVHPEKVVDASVTGPLATWKSQLGSVLEGRVTSVVPLVQECELPSLEAQSAEAGVSVLTAQIPFRLEDPAPLALPNAPFPVALSTQYTAYSDVAVAGLAAALQAGYTVDIDVQTLEDRHDESGWEALEDLITKATASGHSGVIILSNILPPPHDLELPIVRLLTHPTYHTYQSHVATLALVPNLYVKFLPPAWNAPTPHTPAFSPVNDAVSKEKKEWKRRIKMYVGPAVEAFGFQRILFGSAPSSTSTASSTPGDWYEIARESFAELGVEQADVDAIFGGNARAIYAPKS